MRDVTVIGAGLAGSEAAWQLARRGVKVHLVEMKPKKYSPAHHSPGFAELVCSNSLRSAAVTNAVGLLKEELRRLGSLIMEAADRTSVPAGSALAVDRVQFSEYITRALRSHPLIEVTEEERAGTEAGEITVIATGPLTSEPMARYIAGLVGDDSLSFFDAAAPIVERASVNEEIAYFASRYGKGEASYLNCPMTEEEYDRFYDALIHADCAVLHEFDQPSSKVFEGCMPVEVMAKRGRETLLFGPLKPVGLPDPRTGRDPFAVVQLRAENREGTMYNLVGFQTHLTFEAQRQVFRLIPGLEEASFLRYGVMHRNTYLNSPKHLDATYALRTDPDLFFAGQMTGVEGYVESTCSGLVAGINAARRAMGEEPFLLPDTTVTGALAAYISNPSVTDFQPMNANFGLVAPLGFRVKGGKPKKYEALAERALEAIAVCGEAVGEKEEENEDPS